jgi:TPR repeat protein
MGKFKQFLPIFTTAVVLTGIVLLVFFRDNIPQRVMPDIMDSDYISFYKKACELNDAEACNDLGLIYDYGKNGEGVDHEEAYLFYGLACNLDHDSACNNLAYL